MAEFKTHLINLTHHARASFFEIYISQSYSFSFISLLSFFLLDSNMVCMITIKSLPAQLVNHHEIISGSNQKTRDQSSFPCTIKKELDTWDWFTLNVHVSVDVRPDYIDNV